MTAFEIVDILRKGLTEQEINCLNIDKLVRVPGAQGFINVGNKWFTYNNQDERGNISFHGPFNDKSLIYAIAISFYKSDKFESYKFSEQEYQIFFHNHFSSIEEIRELKMDI